MQHIYILNFHFGPGCERFLNIVSAVAVCWTSKPNIFSIWKLSWCFHPGNWWAKSTWYGIKVRRIKQPYIVLSLWEKREWVKCWEVDVSDLVNKVPSLIAANLMSYSSILKKDTESSSTCYSYQENILCNITHKYMSQEAAL